MIKGRIVKLVSGTYTVEDSQHNLYECKKKGILKYKNINPIVGDIVTIEDNLICDVAERKNELRRPVISNVDQALIVMSCVEPDFSTTLVDRLLFLITLANIKPIICVTKMDLLKNEELLTIFKQYQDSGYELVCFNRDTNEGKHKLAEILNNKITVLTGQSGVGKSTLINYLEPSFELRTQVISKALNRGKHTTRHVELMKVCNGLVADTPGFSSLDFSHLEISDLAQNILDFRPFVSSCKFNDCKHLEEPGCAVKDAVSKNIIPNYRYEHYLECVQMIKERKEKYR